MRKSLFWPPGVVYVLKFYMNNSTKAKVNMPTLKFKI